MMRPKHSSVKARALEAMLEPGRTDRVVRKQPKGMTWLEHQPAFPQQRPIITCSAPLPALKLVLCLMPSP